MKGNGSDDCKIKVVATCFSADFKQNMDVKLDQIPLHRMHERISHTFFTDQKSDKNYSWQPIRNLFLKLNGF